MKHGWYRIMFTLVMVSIFIITGLPAGTVVAQSERFRKNWQMVIPVGRGEPYPIVKTPYGYTVVKPVVPTIEPRSRPKVGVLVVVTGPEKIRRAEPLITDLAAVTTRRLANRLNQNVLNLNSIQPPRMTRGRTRPVWIPKAYQRLESVLAIKVSVKKDVARLKPVLVWPHSGQSRHLNTVLVRWPNFDHANIYNMVIMPAMMVWKNTAKVWFHIRSHPSGQLVTYYYRSIKNIWGTTPIEKGEPVYVDLGQSARIEVRFKSGECFYETIAIVKGMYPIVELTFSRYDNKRPRCRSH
jgi:hypothetical protein